MNVLNRARRIKCLVNKTVYAKSLLGVGVGKVAIRPTPAYRRRTAVRSMRGGHSYKCLLGSPPPTSAAYC